MKNSRLKLLLVPLVLGATVWLSVAQAQINIQPTEKAKISKTTGIINAQTANAYIQKNQNQNLINQNEKILQKLDLIIALLQKIADK